MQNKKQYEEELVKETVADFLQRQEERRSFEQQWCIDLNYLSGNQYCEVAPSGAICEEDKNYYWQMRSVFNHIAPIIDTRLAKLGRVRPTMSIRASSGEDDDIKTAKTASTILNSTCNRLNLSDVISKVTIWSESTGTGFYKIVWNANKGKKLGKTDKGEVYEGDVEVYGVSPFEIFPENLFEEDIEKQRSIIHARAVNVEEIESAYGVKINAEELDVFTLTGKSASSNGIFKSKEISCPVKNSAILIEKYELPTSEFPEGRVIVIAGNKLLSISELPYLNGVEGARTYPFIKQCALIQPGCFFGVSLIDRIIPLQRAYNAVKNRKHEFINRISMGIVAVEDGSVDVDELTDEGLSPGKILVYRQGSTPPLMMNYGSVPSDFTYEEERLLSEFTTISGTSEVSRISQMPSSATSGAALELIIEQDETRLSLTAEQIRQAVKKVGTQIIRLMRQFVTGSRLLRAVGENGKVDLMYFSSSDLSSDDVTFDTENELNYSPAQKKTAVYEMLNSGLLSDEGGKLSEYTKSKILDLLGYGSLAGAKQTVSLHRSKAEKENLDAEEKEPTVAEYDDHEVHIEEHTKYLISLDISGEEKKKLKENLLNHIKEHKKMTFASEIAKVE